MEGSGDHPRDLLRYNAEDVTCCITHEGLIEMCGHEDREDRCSSQGRKGLT